MCSVQKFTGSGRLRVTDLNLRAPVSDEVWQFPTAAIKSRLSSDFDGGGTTDRGNFQLTLGMEASTGSPFKEFGCRILGVLHPKIPLAA